MWGRGALQGKSVYKLYKHTHTYIYIYLSLPIYLNPPKTNAEGTFQFASSVPEKYQRPQPPRVPAPTLRAAASLCGVRADTLDMYATNFMTSFSTNTKQITYET